MCTTRISIGCVAHRPRSRFGAGKHGFREALIDKPLDLSPQNHSRVVMPVRFYVGGGGAAARSLLQRQELPYQITGAVILDTPVGERRVQLKSNGNVHSGN